jgi:hypothetical protein
MNLLDEALAPNYDYEVEFGLETFAIPTDVMAELEPGPGFGTDGITAHQAAYDRYVDIIVPSVLVGLVGGGYIGAAIFNGSVLGTLVGATIGLPLGFLGGIALLYVFRNH